MKKTININLAGYPFTIDEDAYSLLKDYLDTIRYAFVTQEDTEDLAADIEARIAEILLEKEDRGFRIVTIDEISRVIERIGQPSDFIDLDQGMEFKENISESNEINDFDRREDEEVEIKIEESPSTQRPDGQSSGSATPPPYNGTKNYWNTFTRKRLFRDPQNSMLGGVCSGLAHYLKIDVTIVRLLAVLLFFLSASTVTIVYIILWIVVPAAQTPLQRLQMMGEDPTVENIGKTVTENFQDKAETREANCSNGNYSGFLSTAFSVFVKFLIVLGLIVAIPLIVAFGIGFIGCVIAVFIIGLAFLGGFSSGPDGMFDSVNECLLVFYILLAVIGGLITLGVPLWLFFSSVWKKKNRENASSRKTMLVVWLCGIALLSVFTVKAVKRGRILDKMDRLELYERLENMNIGEDGTDQVIDEEGVEIKDRNGKRVIINKGGVSVEIEESTVTTETTDSLSMVENRIDTIK